YGAQHDAFPGINAATLSFVLGDRSTAQRLAKDILARLEASKTSDFWDLATAGEARLLLGEFDRAGDAYAAAYRAASGDPGSVATMRRQIALLLPALPEAAGVLGELPAPDVVAFAGHMIDTPDRPVPRFPAALAPAVEAAIRERFARFHQPIVYTSAACGADL